MKVAGAPSQQDGGSSSPEIRGAREQQGRRVAEFQGSNHSEIRKLAFISNEVDKKDVL